MSGGGGDGGGVFLVFWTFQALTMSESEKERERESFFLISIAHGVLFIEKIRVGEDSVRMGRILDRYNPRTWPFGCPMLQLLRSSHPDVRFEKI